jgi:hypothetical protein
MMRKYCYVGTLFLIMMMAACQKDIPKPETKDITYAHNEVIQASGLIMASSDSLLVKHQVKGNDVYVECIVKGASFRDNGAKLLLFIDGKKMKEVNNAAFIVKGLNAGTHKIKLDLLKRNINTVAATEEFEVVIR